MLLGQTIQLLPFWYKDDITFGTLVLVGHLLIDLVFLILENFA